MRGRYVGRYLVGWLSERCQWKMEALLALALELGALLLEAGSYVIEDDVVYIRIQYVSPSIRSHFAVLWFSHQQTRSV